MSAFANIGRNNRSGRRGLSVAEKRASIVPPPMRAPTTREIEIAELLADDLTPNEIAERLGVSRGAVQGMISRIRARLGWQAS